MRAWSSGPGPAESDDEGADFGGGLGFVGLFVEGDFERADEAVAVVEVGGVVEGFQCLQDGNELGVGD